MIRRRPHPRATPSAPAPHRSRARRGQGELLHDEILDAAEALLVTTGDEDSVSIRAIAQAVGVTPPSIYLHFPDKETLLFAVCARQFDRFDEVMAAAAVPATDPVDELRRRGEAYVRFGLEHPEAYRIMFMGQSTLSTRQRGAIEKTGSTAFTHHVEAVQRAIDSGGLRADLDAAAHRDLSLGRCARSHVAPDLARGLPLARP